MTINYNYNCIWTQVWCVYFNILFKVFCFASSKKWVLVLRFRSTIVHVHVTPSDTFFTGQKQLPVIVLWSTFTGCQDICSWADTSSELWSPRVGQHCSQQVIPTLGWGKGPGLVWVSYMLCVDTTCMYKCSYPYSIHVHVHTCI